MSVENDDIHIAMIRINVIHIPFLGCLGNVTREYEEKENKCNGMAHN